MCDRREYFFEHCYFSDLYYDEYHCYPFLDKMEWSITAAEEFKNKYPHDAADFNLIKRSVYNCISSHAEHQNELLDLNFDAPLNDPENEVVMKSRGLPNAILEGALISQWSIILGVGVYLVYCYVSLLGKS